MIVETKSVIKTLAKYSEDKNYRYLIQKIWEPKKPRAMVIMVNPSSASELLLDMTTVYVLNNLMVSDVGGVDIVNLYPRISYKLCVDECDIDEIEINDKVIVELAENVDRIILAWGRAGDKSKSILNRQEELILKLEPYIEKMYILSDYKGEKYFHPLSPRVRFSWSLIPYKS